MTDWRYRIEVATTTARLRAVGPLIPGSWSRQSDELGREIRGEFLLDTGAYGAMIDQEIAEALQLTSQGMREIHGIHGYGRFNSILAEFRCRRSTPKRGVRSIPQSSYAWRFLLCAIRIVSTARMSLEFSDGCFCAMLFLPLMV